MVESGDDKKVKKSKQRRGNMSRIQIIIDSIAGAVGAVLGFMYGEVNGLFRALIAFMTWTM